MYAYAISNQVCNNIDTYLILNPAKLKNLYIDLKLKKYFLIIRLGYPDYTLGTGY